jgi:hypothetical protein
MNNHGDLKSLLLLWENLANNRRYQDFVHSRDVTEIRTRLNNEGLPFFTSALPLIGKALDSFHSTFEWVAPKGFSTFVEVINGVTYNIPHLLGNAVSKALGGDSLAVDCVRQLTLVFYKYEDDYDDQTREAFLQKFCETDAGLSTLTIAEDFVTPLQKLIVGMRRLIAQVLCNTDPRKIRPCHGTGATACRTANEDKYHQFAYFPQLDEIYPYADHFFYSPSHLIDEMEKLEESTVGVSQARVCLVPKDSRGPRVISCEPAEFMFIQKGLMSLLYEAIESHKLTAGQVNFTDQSINRELAHSASITDEYSTIDLSDASDRVSLRLVELVFPPNWVECFKACRSDTTLLPNGTVVKLNKFAPMGSACCFPVEALVFWACAEAQMMSVPGYKTRSTFVYGDDIIVPSDKYDVVVEGLKTIDLIVNENKSYKVGPFRESCGGDFHLGVNVTPVRVKRPLVVKGSGYAANADLANSFIAKFGYTDSHRIIKDLEWTLGVTYPRTSLPTPCTIMVPEEYGASACNDVFFRKRFNKEFQRFEYRILRPTLNIICPRPPDWGELLRKELSGGFTESRWRANRDTVLPLLEEEHQLPVWLSYGQQLLKVIDRKLEPGQYADVQSAHYRWTWTWLG